MPDPIDLTRLQRLSRSKPTKRELVCPKCGAPVELTGGLLLCESIDQHTFRTLTELAVKGRAE